MKKLLLTLGFLTAALTARAQTTTNIAYRVTVETVTGGVTNSAVTNFRYDASNASDAAKINGFALAFATYRAGGGSKDFGAWLKQDVTDRAKAYADAKAAADNAALLAKISALLLSNPDLLSASDLSNLATIAAKAP